VHNACQVVELRQYTLHAGRRDELIKLFESSLIEPQQEAGMHLLGLFHDLDDPDRFVWLRGFPDMAARRDALTAFYLEGEAWASHRGVANATMADSDNVLLLTPVAGAPSLCDAPARPPAGRYTVLVTPWSAASLAALLDRGVDVLAAWRTEHAANTFPRLPVREGLDVLVVLVAGEHGAPDTNVDAQVLRLAPTPRSALK
jgi:hypothetical protein